MALSSPGLGTRFERIARSLRRLRSRAHGEKAGRYSERSKRAAQWAAGKLDVLTRRLVYVVAILAGLVLLHVFTHFSDRAPYVAVDDSLANISAVLAKGVMYGFPASPLEFTHVRLHVMLNYGPASFLLGAALDWLFGTSYGILRAVHPISIAGVAFFAFLTFRRSSVAAAALVSALLLEVFWGAQWPMFRPDPVVSLCAAGALAAFAWALRTGRGLAWWLAGFATSTAVTTHQIAWALIPASFVVWSISLLTTREAAKPLHSFLLLGAGGVCGALPFLVAIDLEIPELVEMWRTYAKFTAALPNSAGLTFVALAGQHFHLAWLQVGGWTAWTIAVLVLATPLAAIRAVARRQPGAIALVVPPLVFAVAYQLSLGVYTNFHRGYEILTQVLAIWSAGAVIAAIMDEVKARRLALGGGAELMLRSLCVVALLAAADEVRSDTSWTAYATRSVSFGDYLRQTMSLLPKGARAWGDAAFGLESGLRDNLVDLKSATTMAAFFPPEREPDYAPDFLVLGRLINDLTFWFLETKTSGGRYTEKTAHGFLRTINPGSRYRPIAIVDAPPYGTTATYSITNVASPNRLPTVAVYDLLKDQWLHTIGEPLAVQPTAAQPVDLTLRYYQTVHAVADRSISLDLPDGVFLATFAPQKTSTSDIGGVLIATPTLKPDLDGGDLGFGVPQAVYFDQDAPVYMILRHRGGRIFISQFDADPEAGFSLIDLRPITGPEPRKRGAPVPIENWKLVDAAAAMQKVGSATMVTGDRTKYGYQFMSPPVTVPPRSRMTLTLPIRQISGSVGVGVLSKDRGSWLAVPSSSDRVEFSTGDSDEITVVVANDNATELPDPVRFVVEDGTLNVSDEIYVEILARCYPGYREPRPAYCTESKR